jgi:hypothetical protein
LQHLKMTVAGQEIIANLYGNVLVVEKEIAANATNSGEKYTSKYTSKLMPDSNRFKFLNLGKLTGSSDGFIWNSRKENLKTFFGLFRTQPQLHQSVIRGFQILKIWF